MDHFGIGAGVLGAARIYMHGGRRTGRTTSLVESLKDGDRVVCASRAEAHRLEGLIRERGVKATCVTVPPGRLDEAYQRGQSEGRTIFDHSWVEGYYQRVLERAADDLDHVQTNLSGEGEAHRKTRRQAEEMVKWEIPR